MSESAVIDPLVAAWSETVQALKTVEEREEPKASRSLTLSPGGAGNETSENIPILTLNRLMKDKPLLDSRIVNEIVSFFAPNHEEVTTWHRRFFARLANKHEGKLTKEFIELYWKQATEMNRQRIEGEKEIAKLQKTKGGGK